MSLVKNPLDPAPNGGHLTDNLRMFSAIQWDSELYRERPKACCYDPFNLDGYCFHNFPGQEPPRYNDSCFIYDITC